MNNPIVLHPSGTGTASRVYAVRALNRNGLEAHSGRGGGIEQDRARANNVRNRQDHNKAIRNAAYSAALVRPS
jgi:hypothetical protein